MTVIALGAAGVLTPMIAAGAAQASTSPQTVYVAPGAGAWAADRNCSSAAFGSIASALGAVRTGGTVIVCGGTYDTQVTVSRQVTLEGREGATIDASGQINGVLVSASRTTIKGLTIENAVGEGVLITGADHVTVTGDTVRHNDLGGTPTNPVSNTYAECSASQGVPGDCGEGIHLMGSSYDTIAGDVSEGNSGGILISDETAPSAHNVVRDNLVEDNVFDCGITVVAHSPKGAPGGVPDPSAGGVFDNDVAGNVIEGNGTQGEGAGVVLATGLPGGAVYDNTVEDNHISGNGMSGVTVHSHVPDQFLNGNVIRGNFIGTNNLNGDKDFFPAVDTQTTGVLVGTVSPLSITVTGNVIAADHFGIWTTGPAAVTGARDNEFTEVPVHVANN
jgi:nitrous oxidase accessory protein NosD